MREPGGLLLRLADALGLTRLRDTVLLPAVADMQHECGEAGSGARHTWALLRGYWGIVSGCAFYATQLPWRHLRENWVGVEAPGPRLLRMAAPVAALVTGLTSGAALAAWPNERGFGFGHLALLLPGMAVSVAALALATGVGWTLARNPSMSRAAVGVGVLGAGLSFAFFEVVVTTANQEFRVVGFQALTGRGNELRKGSREMTLRELGDVAALANVSACPPKAGRPSCGGGPSPTFLRTEWHNRLSLPAFVFSFVILAAVLSRNGRRAVVVPGVFFAFVAAFLLLRLGEKLGIQGDVPVVLAAWIPHLVPLGLAALLSRRVTPGDRGSVFRDDSPLRP